MFKKALFLFFITLSALTLGACDSSSSDDDSNTPEAVTVNLKTTAANALPEIQSTTPLSETLSGVVPSSSHLPVCDETVDWACQANAANSTHMAYMIYKLIANIDDEPTRLYLPTTAQFNPLDEWGAENLYNNLEILGLVSGSLTLPGARTVTETVGTTTFDATLSTISRFSPLEAITPPPFPYFPSLDAVTYEYYRTATVAVGSVDIGSIDLTWKVAGNVTNILFGTASSSPPEAESSVSVAQYDSVSGDLILNLASNTTLSGSPDYRQRMDVTGNTISNSFTLRYYGRGGPVSSNKFKVVGKGVTRGAGNYFFFKTRLWTVTEPVDTYFCVSALATKVHFGTAYNSGGAFTDVPDGGGFYIKRSATLPADGWCQSGTTYETDVDVDAHFLDGELPATMSDYNSTFLP